MISQTTINKIFSVADIGTVAGEFVSLHKKGDHLVGFCPFEKEQKISLTVSPNIGLFKCFECGRGGNVINFIMEHEQLSYEEAVRFLAKKFDIEVEEEENLETDQTVEGSLPEGMMKASEWAQKYFSHQLLNEEEGRSIALSYLHYRGITDEAISKFGVGYCPSKHGSMTAAAEHEQIPLEHLEKTGLTIKRDDWIRDRFESRVIFPIHNVAGRVIGFGGRTMAENSEKKIAKYLNSPESEIYHKSNVLYGISQAKSAIVELDKCYIVEGYTDVVSMHMSGVTNVVASAGTALTIEQIRLLRRFTNTVCMIYDGDAAGIGASIRGVERILKEGMNVKVIPLPEGEDPDSFSRARTKEEMQTYIEESEIDFIQFASRIRLNETKNDPIKRAEAISEIVRLISVIPYLHVRTSYMRECSLLMNIREEHLYLELRKYQQYNTEQFFKNRENTNRRSSTQMQEQSLESTIQRNPFELEEREVLRFLLRFGDKDLMEEEIEGTAHTRKVTVANYILEELEKDEIRSADPVVQAILDEYNEQRQKFNFEAIRHFVLHSDKQISQLCSDLLAEKYTESRFWVTQGSYVEKIEDVLPMIIPRVVEEYKLKRVVLLQKQLVKQMSLLDMNVQFEEVLEIQQKIQNLNQLKKILSESLGNRTIH